jgi:hypothetical protein
MFVFNVLSKNVYIGDTRGGTKPSTFDQHLSDYFSLVIILWLIVSDIFLCATVNRVALMDESMNVKRNIEEKIFKVVITMAWVEKWHKKC